MVMFTRQLYDKCKPQADIIYRLASEFSNKFDFYLVDTDLNLEPITFRYNITSVPTYLVFKHGHKVDKIVGFQTYGGLRKAVMKYLGR